jgi:hypothetical protein
LHNKPQGCGASIASAVVLHPESVGVREQHRVHYVLRTALILSSPNNKRVKNLMQDPNLDNRIAQPTHKILKREYKKWAHIFISAV